MRDNTYWNAACSISDTETYFACHAINFVQHKNKHRYGSKCRKFDRLFNPNDHFNVWFGDFFNNKNQLDRFVALLLMDQIANSK